MGLDMYVTIRHKDTQSKLDAYEAWENKYSYEEYELLSDEQREEHCNSEPEYDDDMYGKELMYWRKANQIHNWFVQNVQDGKDDCGLYEVSKEKLKELLELCLIVLRESRLIDGKVFAGRQIKNGDMVDIYEEGKCIEDPSLAKELLPTTDGFFFGGTAYDEWYYKDLENTVEILMKVLNETDFENEMIVYQSSW